MWLQLDGAPSHNALSIRQFLNTRYPQYIGHDGTPISLATTIT